MVHTNVNNSITFFDKNHINNKNNDSEQQIALDNISKLKSCAHQLGDIDRCLDNSDSLNMEVLSLIVNQQKQVVLSMLGLNAEKEISGILAASIEIYTQKLEKIYGWTQGGVEMFRSCLIIMFEDMKNKGIGAENLEDLFQLALLEILVNAKEYGLENWYDKNKNHISHILESTGSGSHSLHESDYNSPENMAKWVKQLYDELKEESNIPKESFLGQIMAELDNKGGSQAIHDQIINGWNDDYGWWVEKPNSSTEKSKTRGNAISPMLKLFILSGLMNEKKLNKEQVELVLTGSLADIDKFISSEFDVDTNKHESAALAYLVNNSAWQLQYKNGIYQIDWKGDGINISDLYNLHQKFPGRELTEDELEEINRIGDQIKMLQQTLKYWTQLCTDQQLAFARNI